MHQTALHGDSMYVYTNHGLSMYKSRNSGHPHLKSVVGILSVGILSGWNLVRWDFVRWDFVRWDFVLAPYWEPFHQGMANKPVIVGLFIPIYRNGGINYYLQWVCPLNSKYTNDFTCVCSTRMCVCLDFTSHYFIFICHHNNIIFNMTY